MTREKDCPVCIGSTTHHADGCPVTWEESPSSPRRILWGVGIGLAGLALAYLLTSCAPATLVSGPHDCTEYGYHKHLYGLSINGADHGL